MKQIVPNYYNKFKCKAEKCIHNCCVGWEIEIDPQTYTYYKSLDNYIGKKTASCTYTDTDGAAYFVLDKHERCPFLNDRGLCEIIIDLGENALCQVCTLHPRFKNFFSSHIEIGLGLCCEKAAEIIIPQKNKFEIAPQHSSDEQENFFFKLRQNIFDIIQDRDFSFSERVENLFCFFNINPKTFSSHEIIKILNSLETLDSNWPIKYSAMSNKVATDGFDTEFEQLFCYFIFRHLTDAIEDGLYIERIKLCSFLYQTTAAIAAADGLSTNSIIDTARALSAELEYSDQNIQSILQMIN